MSSRKIMAFGKLVNRSKAYEIIINDKICEIVYARNSNALEDLLMDGWQSLSKWSDEDLEVYITGLCIQNQPNGKI